VAREPKIERIETILVDVPTIRPHKLAMTTMNAQTLMVVRILASDGVEGIGEGTTIGGLAYGAESPEGMKQAIDLYFAPHLLGREAIRVGKIMAEIGKAVRDNRFAKCAVETALYDAVGKRCGLPVSELLGGRRHDRLEVAWTLASGDTGRDVSEAEAMLEMRRHRIFKLKIGARALEEDVAHVATIKRSLGDRAKVRVDVNQAWSETEAACAIPALADAGVELVEQPIAAQARAGMARLARESRIAVMADESLNGPESAYDFVAHTAANVLAVKISQSGGLAAAQRVAAIGEAAGVGLYGGTMLEGGVGTAASAQVFSTFGRLEWGTELFGPLLLTEEILAEPLDYADFGLKVPTGPGLGVALDEHKLAKFRRDRTKRGLREASSSASGA
jgi:muconate cycloisomerase